MFDSCKRSLFYMFSLKQSYLPLNCLYLVLSLSTISLQLKKGMGKVSEELLCRVSISYIYQARCNAIKEHSVKFFRKTKNKRFNVYKSLYVRAKPRLISHKYERFSDLLTVKQCTGIEQLQCRFCWEIRVKCMNLLLLKTLSSCDARLQISSNHTKLRTWEFISLFL